jgi:hypothetical protein
LLCSQFGSDGVIFCSICFTCQILPPSRYSVALPQVAGEMAVFTEGDEGQWSNIIALGNLPVFTD